MQTDTPFGCKHVPENNFASNIVKKVVLAYVIRKKKSKYTWKMSENLCNITVWYPLPILSI